MKIFEAIISKCKSKGINVLLDLVPNHVSNQHSWFQKALSGDKKYRDYFIWKKGKGHSEERYDRPSNWGSM